MALQIKPLEAPGPGPGADGLEREPVTDLVIAEDRAPSTQLAYQKDWADFVAWCGRSDRPAMPTSAETAAAYAAHLAWIMSRSPASVERVRSAIRAAHLGAGEQPPDAFAFNEVVRSYRDQLAKAKDPRAEARSSESATPDAVADIVSRLDLNTAAGLRDAALILVGLCTSCRGPELAALDISDVTPLRDGYQIRFRSAHRSRTIQRSEPDRPCASTALSRWLGRLEAEGRTTGPLFVRIDQHGNLAARVLRGGKEIGDPDGRMTAQAISRVIGRRAAGAALEGLWSSGSLRRGGWSGNLIAAYDPKRVRELATWMSHEVCVVYGDH